MQRVFVDTNILVYAADPAKPMHQVSHWDRLILATAMETQCDRLYSEDLSRG